MWDLVRDALETPALLLAGKSHYHTHPSIPTLILTCILPHSHNHPSTSPLSLTLCLPPGVIQVRGPRQKTRGQTHTPVFRT